MRKFKLVGPHAGKTISLGGYDFIQGVYTDDSGFVVTEGPDGLLILLARSYNAHPLNSQALRDAEEAMTATIAGIMTMKIIRTENTTPV